jgi:hypothetical protein
MSESIFLKDKPYTEQSASKGVRTQASCVPTCTTNHLSYGSFSVRVESDDPTLVSGLFLFEYRS